MIENDLEKKLLDGFQHGFPLVPRPYAELAARLGTDEDTVLELLRGLKDQGFISRIGAVLAPHTAGWSTLAAMEVPEQRLQAVADLVSGYEEVNHNYEREHRLNLWFVLTGPDRERVQWVLSDIEAQSGLNVLDLPLMEAYRLDLGFSLQWN